jgi:hypothetical protein
MRRLKGRPPQFMEVNKMQCGHYVKWETRRRRGSGVEYQKAVDIKATTHFGDELLAQGYTICAGTVRCTRLEAVDEPDWGTTYAKLEVDYTCDTCGCTFYPELGMDADIENTSLRELVNLGIDTITPEEQQARRAEFKRQQTLSIAERVAEARKKVAAVPKTT